MTTSFLFDAYAILEILKGNPNYARYQEAKIVTTQLHLFEVYLTCLRYHGSSFAKEILNRYKGAAIAYDDKVIASAGDMRHDLKERRLSMADVIGYSLAAQLRIPFLTGDRQFQDLPNVEFVR